MANHTGVSVERNWYRGLRTGTEPTAEMQTPSNIRFGKQTSQYGDLYSVAIIKFTIPAIGRSESIKFTVTASDDAGKYGGSRAVKYAFSKTLTLSNPSGGSLGISAASWGTWAWTLDDQKLVSTNTLDCKTTSLEQGVWYLYLWGSDSSCTLHSVDASISFNDVYTVTFASNGGDNPPAPQTKVYGVDLTLTRDIPVRSNFWFNVWNTSATGNGDTYEMGGVYRKNESVTLYAIWVPNSYRLNINQGAGTIISVNRTESPYKHASTGALSNNALIYYGDKLTVSYSVWDGYTLGAHTESSYVVSGTVTVSASATVNSYRLTISAQHSSITVRRTDSPRKGAATGTLTNGATIYYGDKLSVTYAADTGWTLGTHSASSFTVSGNLTVSSTATPNEYRLTISAGTGTRITVSRASSPNKGAATGTLTNGATIYFGDTLTATYAADTGWTLGAHSAESFAVSGTVTVSASATVNSYTLSITARNATVTVRRTESPNAGAATGTLENNAAIYYGDKLTVSYSVGSAFEVDTALLNGSAISSGASHTVTGRVTVSVSGKILGSVWIDGAQYLVYIDNGTAFGLYSPNEDDGTSWKICSA